MPGFVIEFNRTTRERVVHRFDDASEAMRYRLERERVRSNADIEIAALSASSIEALQRTHSRYFSGEELTAI